MHCNGQIKIHERRSRQAKSQFSYHARLEQVAIEIRKGPIGLSSNAGDEGFYGPFLPFGKCSICSVLVNGGWLVIAPVLGKQAPPTSSHGTLQCIRYPAGVLRST